MSAVEEYHNCLAKHFISSLLERRADAAISELEAENERLRKGLRLIIERNPGQAHRIAIQILDPARAEEGTSEDTYAGQCWGGADTPDERARAEEGGE